MEKVILLIIFAYLIGSIPFGIIIGKFFKGVDIREFGSGNIGAANAFRTLGPVAGIFVLVIDVAKGFLPTFLALKLVPAEFVNISCVLVGFFAIVGHNCSVFLKFKGGKGIATSLGIFLCLSWKASLVALVVYAVVVSITKISSVGSLTGALSVPVGMYFFKAPVEFISFAVLAVIFAFYMHRKNIARLIRGEELKVKERR